MRALTSLMVAAVVLVGADDASAVMTQQGDVASFVFEGGTFADGTMETPLLSDFVLTDIRVTTANTGSNSRILFYENEGGVLRASIPCSQVQLQSGVPFAGGTRIHFEMHPNGVFYSVTLAGYYPDPPGGTAAAIGPIGLVVLGGAMLVAGGHVMRQRKMAA